MLLVKYHVDMRLFIFLCFLTLGIVFAAKEVRVKTYHETEEECATWLDDYMFNETLYKIHYDHYYNNKTIPEEYVRSEASDTSDAHSRSKRDMHKNVQLWPNATIPYLISCDYTESERIFFANAMRILEERTCIRFVRNEDVVSNTFIYMDKTPTNNTICSANTGAHDRWPILYDGKDSAYTKYNFRESCFWQYRGVGTVTHELMHILGFYHQHQRFDSGISRNGDPTVPENDSIFFGPYDRYSSVGYRSPRYLTDWDVLKINRAYQCRHTTRGNRPIDISKVDSNRKSKGDIYRVPQKCGFNGQPKRNVASFTVDFQRNTLNYTNLIEPMFEDCFSDSNCLLPYLKISKEGDQFAEPLSRDRIRSDCTIVSIWSNIYYPNYQQVNFPVDFCTEVIETDDGKTLCIVAKF